MGIEMSLEMLASYNKIIPEIPDEFFYSQYMERIRRTIIFCRITLFYQCIHYTCYNVKAIG